MEQQQFRTMDDIPRVARIRAKADGSHIVIYFADRRRFTIEKSALIPPTTTKVWWEKTHITPCGVGVIPAAPKDIQFISTDILTLVDPAFAAQEVQRRFANAVRWAPVISKYRGKCKFTIGQAAERSGIDGLTISRMEAGYPVFPLTAQFKLLHTFIRELWRMQGKSV